MADRSAAALAFLQAAGWGAAEMAFLAGDASARRYHRLSLQGRTAVLMDAPPGQGEDTATFRRIAAHLGGLGLSPPQVLAADDSRGFLLLEDLGDDLFARLIPRNPVLEPALYAAATDVLVQVQAHPPAQGLNDAGVAGWAAATLFVLDWYRFAVTGSRVDGAPLAACIADLLTACADGPRVMILRDYHAENLLWLPARAGTARVGLLDFQLAQLGQPGYDLVSLLQDARRDVSSAVEAAMIRRFVAATGTSEAAFSAACAVLGAQRALRILGVFARLSLLGGKPGYVALMPRVWGQLQANLAHPALAPLATLCGTLLPPPTPAAMERITRQCGTIPAP